jgi:PAS domain-containing protein
LLSETLHAMFDGDIKLFFAISGNFVSNTPDTVHASHAMQRCKLTAHVSTKLNRSHLITGERAIRLALAIPVTTSSGEQVVSYAIYRDITERKRAEERLRESEARFQTMADTVPVLIWMTGTDGLCNYFNKPWLDFTSRTMEQEVGVGVDGRRAS